MERYDSHKIPSHSVNANSGGKMRRPWTTPALAKLKKPSEAQTGILLGPEIILLIQS
jgi:hypothetical protein